jgi:hypothetical protein
MVHIWSRNTPESGVNEPGELHRVVWRSSPLHEPLHWEAKRDPKAKMLYLQSFLRKGVSLGYVGRIKT